MSSNSETALTHDMWQKTLRQIARDEKQSNIARELATFCGVLLFHCGDNPQVIEYLNNRASTALEKDDAPGN